MGINKDDGEGQWDAVLPQINPVGEMINAILPDDPETGGVLIAVGASGVGACPRRSGICGQPRGRIHLDVRKQIVCLARRLTRGFQVRDRLTAENGNVVMELLDADVSHRDGIHVDAGHSEFVCDRSLPCPGRQVSEADGTGPR